MIAEEVEVRFTSRRTWSRTPSTMKLSSWHPPHSFISHGWHRWKSAPSANRSAEQRQATRQTGITRPLSAPSRNGYGGHWPAIGPRELLRLDHWRESPVSCIICPLLSSRSTVCGDGLCVWCFPLKTARQQPVSGPAQRLSANLHVGQAPSRA